MMEKDLLFCLQALNLGLLEEPVLLEAGHAAVDGGGELRAEVVRRAALSEADVAQLDRSVELLVNANGGDLHASLESVGGRRPVAETLRDLIRLDKTLPRSAVPADAPWSRAEPLSDATLVRPSAGAAAEGSGGGEHQITPEVVGRYDVRGEIGRGGIGRVLVAFDEHASREVAIKELLVGEGAGSSRTDTQGASARFLREARLTAQLEHPSIVPVYEVGRRGDGTLYYAMRLVRGRTLAEALRGCQTVEERLRFLHHFTDLCAAVAFAHSRGVLHRDLKPHNVMIGEFNETILLDWGLAKLKGATERDDRRFVQQMEALREAAAGNTVQGAALGTPEYMPPEQAFGDLDRIDEHSDVYSLGAVLYELLTGHPPFTGKRALEILTTVQRYGEGKEQLVPVRTLEPDSPPELAAVAEKALFPQTHGRYQTAKQLLDDINAFMEGRRVSAYQYGKLERLLQIALENRVATGLATALLVALLLGTLLLGIAFHRTRAAEQQVHWDLASAFQEKAERLVAQRDYLGARVFAAAALRESPFNPLSRFPDPRSFGSPVGDQMLASLQSTLWASQHFGMARHLGSLEGSQASVETLRFSPDGRLLASAGMDRVLRVWNVAERRLLHSHEGSKAIIAVAWSPDGRTLAYGESPTLKLWRPGESGEPTTLDGAQESISAVLFSSDGRTLISASRTGTLLLWDVAMGKESGRLTVPSDHLPERLAVSASGRLLASAGLDRDVLVWSLPARRLVAKIEGHEGGVASVIFSLDGKQLWILGNDRTVRVWHADRDEEEAVFTLEEGQPRGFGARFDESGAALLAIGRNETVELWDPASGERVGLVGGHDGQIRAATFSPDGRVLASSGLDKRIHLWEVAQRTKLTRLTGHEATVSAFALSSDGTRLVSGGRDRALFVWDLRSGRSERTWAAHDGEVVGVAFASDGTILSAGRDGDIKRWTPEGQLAKTYSQYGAGSIWSMAVSPDGTQLASAETDHLRLWDLVSGQPVHSLIGHTGQVTSLAFSPDGKVLASGGRDRTVRLWDPATGEARAVWTKPIHERVRALAFSPDGKTLAVADMSWAVTLIDVASQEPLRTLLGHHDGPRALSFSRDGRVLVSAGASDTTVRLWEVPSGRLLQSVDLPGEVRAALLLPDSHSLLAGDGSSMVVSPVKLDLWKRSPDELLAEAERDASMVLERFVLKPRPVTAATAPAP